MLCLEAVFIHCDMQVLVGLKFDLDDQQSPECTIMCEVRC